MDESELQIIKEFISGSSIEKISKKYKINKKIIKDKIKKKLGTEQYTAIYRSNGGKATVKKLENEQYKKEYVNKIRIKVKGKLNKMMKNKKFEEAWIEKAKKAFPVMPAVYSLMV